MSTEEGSAKKRRLGRGLASLLGEDGSGTGSVDRMQQSRTVPIEHVHPGRFQPRRIFNEEELEALAESIREKGVIQPGPGPGRYLRDHRRRTPLAGGPARAAA